MRTHGFLFALVIASLSACGGGTDTDGGTNDSGATDAHRADATIVDGGGTDMTTTVDLGGSDMTTTVDLGDTDMPTAIDLGVDAGPPDAGPPDAGPPDAGPPDMGTVACATPVIPMLHTTDLAAGHTFTQPVFLTQAPGDDDAFYVVEQTGRIQVYRQSTGLVTQFLDIHTTIGTLGGIGDERGLLGLAFHPNYAANGRFFIGYRPTAPARNRVAEYHRSGTDPYMANPAEVVQLVNQTDPETNHNGGWVAFGPDGFLYAALGDGGGGCDAHGTNGNGQDTSILLGKMLRLDVDNVAGMYAAAGNPFSGATGLPQIWAFGLRNAWRNSFDRATGDLWMGDVGQNRWEEVDFQPASSTGGENYGWEAREGTHPATDSCATAATLVGTAVEPITDYSHTTGTVPLSGGAAVTGGYVYRGTAISALAGVYLYADYGSGHVAALRYCAGTLHGPINVPSLSGLDSISSFGQDNQGELYLVGIGGLVAKIVP